VRLSCYVFFSSRRRHTRSKRDWSSDVCSSDLVTFTDEPGTENDTFTVPEVEGVQYLVDGEVIDAGTHPGQGLVTVTAEAVEGYRSEERRVGKGGRGSWTREQRGESGRGYTRAM